MRTIKQIKSELSTEDYVAVLGAVARFRADFGNPTTDNDPAWQQHLQAAMSMLPEALQDDFLDLLGAMIVEGAKALGEVHANSP